MSISQAWASFLGTYHESWGRRHSLFGLIAHPGSSTIGCIRAGGLISALRVCTDVEALWIASATSQTAIAKAGALPAPAPQLPPARPPPACLANDGDLLAVHECVRSVAGLIGQQSMDAFIGLLASG